MVFYLFVYSNIKYDVIWKHKQIGFVGQKCHNL